ncbi:hypothetical protein B0T10DRAFT_595746 [Thelonectria olida]|uniref:Uncharacterized protein n=1 Tax=Thelonectria olida TaxID=1576542 RepID=A0A9P8W6H9_9HYPO|nr:hypothetical protein B0T10DRAFT_595746 [Thelonectria olida]
MSLPTSDMRKDSDSISRELLLQDNKPNGRKGAKDGWLHKISPLSTITMILAYLAIPGAIGFLCFLWSNPIGSENNKHWFGLVSSGWTLKSITITTLILRLAVSAQATISTSMLASIILEHQRVTLHASAPLSSLRFVNNGPLGLIQALYGNYFRVHLWTLVAFFLFCTTVLLQFTSTVLVTDVSIGILAKPEQGHGTLVALSNDNMNMSSIRSVRQVPYWLAATPNYPTFAEYQENVSKHSPDSVRDTGLTHRAFVPFLNSSIRSSIKHYSGATTVLDSRVTCVRPKSHDGLSAAMTEGQGWFLNGTFIPDFVPSGLILPDEAAITGDLNNISFSIDVNNTEDVMLTWAQQVPFAHDAGEWNVIQKLMYLGPALVSSLDPRYSSVVKENSSEFEMTNSGGLPNGLFYRRKDDKIPLMTGRSYLLLNMTVSEQSSPLKDGSDDDNPKNLYFSASQDENKLVLTPRDEWLIFTIPRVPGWRVSVSLCYDSFTSIDANITVSTDDPVTEPNLGTWNVTTEHFGTEAVRRQLGVLEKRQDRTERAILRLQTKPDQLREQVKVWYDESKKNGSSHISLPYQTFMRDDLKDRTTDGTFMCAGCGLGFQDGARLKYQNNNPVQQQIFQDVMTTTNNSAFAWQAYFTLLGRAAYYDMLPYFDVEDGAAISWFQSAQFPRSSRGLKAVVVVLGIHSMLVALIAVVFLSKTTISRVGDNAWQCLTQVNYDEGDDLFRSLTLMKDDEVKETFKKKGLDDRPPGTERLRLQRHQKPKIEAIAPIWAEYVREKVIALDGVGKIVNLLHMGAGKMGNDPTGCFGSREKYISS